MEVDDNDDDYIPSDTSNSSIELDEGESDDSNNFEYELNHEVKYVVFRSMLLSLFTLCQLCGKKGAKAATTCIGTLIIINQTCRACDGSFQWKSQPYIGAIPAGNLLLSAAILFSGALPSKALKLLRFWGVTIYERHTFFRHQNKFLIPAVNNLWDRKQTDLLRVARQSEVTLGGDARCDSMGHSAKYGSYTLLDLDRKKILAMELVQSNETNGSYHMELEGLKRCLNVLWKSNVAIGTLVTDRHAQIQKWLRDNCSQITHYFDIWHVAKGLKKKLVALEKRKGCEQVNKWRRSIINHLYWSVVTSNGNGDLALAKWDSITNHIVDIHSGHSDLFPACIHGPAQKKNFFTPGTECNEKVADILQNKYLMKDVVKLSPLGQTYGVEGFHNLVNHFAPKMFHFGYSGMKSRLLLAVFHYNENSDRIQARTKDGDLQYAIAFPKAKQGGHTVKKVMTECTFGYVDELITEVMSVVDGTAECIDFVDAPPPLCASFEHPDKTVAIESLFTRFPETDSTLDTYTSK
ncbi:uncharacterized protein [Antedon mediterranea]|uniref:uncharacterized protein n=1 Tax=Antedon mediterranea TaxID=105859 RepID=UPI003AF9D304